MKREEGMNKEREKKREYIVVLSVLPQGILHRKTVLMEIVFQKLPPPPPPHPPLIQQSSFTFRLLR